jgi:hypothetical protein
MCFAGLRGFVPLLAGLEGIEPPIEVLETPGIPFTYSPSVSIISRSFVCVAEKE